MPSIRKTKKRLKREIARLYLDKFSKPLLAEDFWDAINIHESIHRQIQQKEQELQQLKSMKA